MKKNEFEWGKKALASNFPIEFKEKTDTRDRLLKKSWNPEASCSGLSITFLLLRSIMELEKENLGAGKESNNKL